MCRFNRQRLTGPVGDVLLNLAVQRRRAAEDSRQRVIVAGRERIAVVLWAEVTSLARRQYGRAVRVVRVGGVVGR
ncbi:MAG: hypothetical protein ACF8TS_19750, partial [Maioricimonas sp. JB049]